MTLNLHHCVVLLWQGLLFKVNGVTPSSPLYGSLANVMLLFCVVFVGAWLTLVVVTTWRRLPKKRIRESKAWVAMEQSTASIKRRVSVWRPVDGGAGSPGGAGSGGKSPPFGGNSSRASRVSSLTKHRPVDPAGGGGAIASTGGGNTSRGAAGRPLTSTVELIARTPAAAPSLNGVSGAVPDAASAGSSTVRVSSAMQRRRGSNLHGKAPPAPSTTAGQASPMLARSLSVESPPLTRVDSLVNAASTVSPRGGLHAVFEEPDEPTSEEFVTSNPLRVPGNRFRRASGLGGTRVGSMTGLGVTGNTTPVATASSPPIRDSASPHDDDGRDEGSANSTAVDQSLNWQSTPPVALHRVDSKDSRVALGSASQSRTSVTSRSAPPPVPPARPARQASGSTSDDGPNKTPSVSLALPPAGQVSDEDDSGVRVPGQSW